MTVSLACLAPAALAVANAASGSIAAIPAGSNTTAPAAPYYIDLSGMTFGRGAPVRDPRNVRYPPAIELRDLLLPGKNQGGNFIVGPSHTPAAETVDRPMTPKGRIVSFTMSSADGIIYNPGVVREEQSFNASVYSAPAVPGDPSQLVVTNSRSGLWIRKIAVYLPPRRAIGTLAPFMVVGDGEFRGGGKLTTVLDNLIAEGRIPPIVVIFVGSGGQDAQGSERGREYDTVSGTYAQWLESEVLPLVEEKTGVRLTHDPNRRAMMGGSSSAVAAFTAAWFRPDLYRRVLSYSPTFVNQQWPHDPALPGGAWEFHSPWAGTKKPALMAQGFAGPVTSSTPAGTPLITSSARKPIRFWFAVGDQDLFYPIRSMADGMHDWVLASENMAKALAARGYCYQFLFGRNAGHVDSALMAQTLPAALEFVWAGDPGTSRSRSQKVGRSSCR